MKSKYIAILGADFHIRETTPACRTDDYEYAQWKKLSFISYLCKANDCPLFVAGDFFDHWKPSPWLLSRCIELLPKTVVGVAGQHDLQNHSLKTVVLTGLNTLQQAGVYISLNSGRSPFLQSYNSCFRCVLGYSFGESLPEKLSGPKNERKIVIWHRMIHRKDSPFPGADSMPSISLLSKYPNTLFLTGDNHQQFVVKANGSVLVNPGSMMRMTSDQKDFEPAVFGLTEDWEVDRIPLPIEKGVVVEVTGSNKEERDARFDAYVTRMKKTFEAKLSFRDNLEAYLAKNKEKEIVKQLIWKAMEEQK